MLAIRLRRIGKKSHPTYRFIVSEKTRSPKSVALEFLGSYDPHTNPATVKVDAERIKHWISKGAQPSDTVHNLLVNAGVISAAKVKVANVKKKDEPAAPAESTPAPVAPAAEAVKEEAPAA